MIKLAKLINLLAIFDNFKKTRTSSPSGILIVTAGGLGDTILFSLILPRFLKLAGERERVSVLIQNSSQKAAFLFPNLVEVICVNFPLFRNNLKYHKKIKKRLFDYNFRLVVSADFLRHPKLDEALIKACSPLDIIGMEPRSWPKYDSYLKKNRQMFSRLFDSGPKLQDKVVRWTSFANWLLNEDEPPPKILFQQYEFKRTKKILKPICIIQPFSAVKEKQSPVALYETLLPLIPKNFEIKITGTSADIKKNPEFGELLKRKNICFDNSNFEELVPIIQTARLVISVDTALMHLACGLGAPTLCLGSAAYINEITPYASETTPSNIRFVYHDMPCRSCLGYCHQPKENYMYPCVARINVVQAQAAVQDLLKIYSNNIDRS